MTLPQLLHTGRLDGFIVGPPPAAMERLLPAVHLDRQNCREAVCEACGQRGLDYVPFHRPGCYRVFGVCSRCGEAHEF